MEHSLIAFTQILPSTVEGNFCPGAVDGGAANVRERLRREDNVYAWIDESGDVALLLGPGGRGEACEEEGVTFPAKNVLLVMTFEASAITQMAE
jgi:hypothetical protein